jgi:hypothetical protein
MSKSRGVLRLPPAWTIPGALGQVVAQQHNTPYEEGYALPWAAMPTWYFYDWVCLPHRPSFAAWTFQCCL